MTPTNLPSSLFVLNWHKISVFIRLCYFREQLYTGHVRQQHAAAEPTPQGAGQGPGLQRHAAASASKVT